MTLELTAIILRGYKGLSINSTLMLLTTEPPVECVNCASNEGAECHRHSFEEALHLAADTELADTTVAADLTSFRTTMVLAQIVLVYYMMHTTRAWHIWNVEKEVCNLALVRLVF